MNMPTIILTIVTGGWQILSSHLWARDPQTSVTGATLAAEDCVCLLVFDMIIDEWE